MRRLTAAILGCAILAASGALARARVAAEWRFEDGRPGEQVSPDAPVADASGNGNVLRAHSDRTAPRYTDVVPFDTVPQTGRPNRVAIDNTAEPPRGMPTRDLFVVHDGPGFDLNQAGPRAWTVEASVLFKPVEGWETRWQTFVGRDGYNIPGGPASAEDPLANLGFKKRGDSNRLSIEAWDGGGTYVTVQSRDPVEADVWYHVAAVSDGERLSLYVKGPKDTEHVRHGDAPFQGALANGRDAWTVGRGCYGYGPTEQFFGLIDEVRISTVALAPARFLASPRPPGAATAVATTAPAPAEADPAPPAAPARRFPPVPPGLIHPHDPALIRVGDAYHAFASHGGISHWRSADFLRWERLPGVHPEPPTWAFEVAPRNPGLWAPDVAQFNGEFHLYYSVSRFGSQRSAIGLIVNETLDPADPRFKWVDRGKVIESSRGMDYNAIDPSIAFDETGEPWMAFGSFNRGIYLVRLDRKTGKQSEADKTAYHIAGRPGSTAIEAPHVFRHGGWYYQILCYDFCCRGARSTYKLMVGRSRQITGPYVDRDGRSMLDGHSSLLVRSHEYHRGPGHSSVVERDGRQFLAHHYYDARADGVPTLAVRPLHWDDDGWPLVGEPLAEQGPPVPNATVAGRWLEFVDYGESAEVEFRDDGSAASPLGDGTWTFDDNRLVITWAKADATTRPVVDRAFVADDRASYVGRRSDGAIVRSVRLEPATAAER